MIIKNNNSWNFALFVNQCKCTNNLTASHTMDDSKEQLWNILLHTINLKYFVLKLWIYKYIIIRVEATQQYLSH